MKKTIVLLLLLISIIVLIMRFGATQFQYLLGFSDKGGISVLSVPQEAQVFLDDKEVGKTPLDLKDLGIGEHLVRIQKDQLKWEGKVNLNSGSVTVVNRDLATDLTSQAGEVLTLEKGQGVTIISNPQDADIEIDGKNIGKTPLNINIDAGDHTINIGHSNYLSRSIRAKLPQGFNLTISVDLSLSETDLASTAVPIITETKEVLVKNTPTGFLRVRDKPSLNGKEIAQVKPGERLVLVEEQGTWSKVKLPDGIEGFVSSDYISIK